MAFHKRFALGFSAVAILLSQAGGAQKLDVVPRTRATDGYVFDRPALVVTVRVHGESKEEFGDESPGSGMIATVTPSYWTYALCEVLEVLRVNERRQGDPDLDRRVVMIEQLRRRERPLPLRMGRIYVLLVTPSPNLLASWQTQQPGEPGRFPPYSMSVEQGGFEVVNGRLKVLKRGGLLDAYDGRPLADVVADMRKHP